MKVEIIYAKYLNDRGFYTHNIADAVKEFVEDDTHFCQDIRFIGKNETLTAIIFYQETNKKGTSHGD